MLHPSVTPYAMRLRAQGDEIGEKKTFGTTLVESTTHEVEEGIGVEGDIGGVHLNGAQIRLQRIYDTELSTLLWLLFLRLRLLAPIEVVENAVAHVQRIVDTIAVDLHGGVQRGARLLEVHLRVTSAPHAPILHLRVFQDDVLHVVDQIQVPRVLLVDLLSVKRERGTHVFV